MDRNRTISEQFDSLYEEVLKLLNDEGIYATEEGKSAGIDRLQSGFENLTQVVSAVEMFSKNESYDEMDPKSLKFILLPYFLGVIWQQKRGIERKEIWTVAEIYFRDFLERLLEAGIIIAKPPVLSVAQQKDQEAASGDSVPVGKNLPSGDDNRRLKIARFKQNKELEAKVKALSERQKDNQGTEDESAVQELYLTLLRKHALDAESELESILAEKELVSSFLVEKTEGRPPPPPKKSGLPFETFIITKTDVQKKIFGRGYPSIPTMTVDELYRDRIQKGIWTAPTPSDAALQSEETEEMDNVIKETLQEADNEELRAYEQRMDDYKDTHRRGWGNRMNRS